MINIFHPRITPGGTPTSESPLHLAAFNTIPKSVYVYTREAVDCFHRGCLRARVMDSEIRAGGERGASSVPGLGSDRP